MGHSFSVECGCEACTNEKNLQDEAWKRAVEKCKAHSPEHLHGRPCQACAYGQFGTLVASLVKHLQGKLELAQKR